MAQLHGSLTPAHADGCGAQCFVGVQCASIFNPARVSSPTSCHACFAVWCFSLSPHGGHGAPTVWLGTNRNVSVCLILRRWPPNGLSFSRCCQRPAAEGRNRERVKLFQPPGAGSSRYRDDGRNELDFQTALHVLVHTHMRLAVFVVKRPGT